jgi:hypothetical protein
MNALDRFNWHRRRFGKTNSRSVDRHLTHAAALEQVLEVARHQIFCGRKFDPESIAAVRDQLHLALKRATIAAAR